jgi:hypothetical protein
MSPLGTPLALPQAAWVAGLTLFVAVALLLILRASWALLRGDLVTVRRLAGPRTLAEELEAGQSASGMPEREVRVR